ncbi:hypothetical protein VP01_3193g3 [Puccinia sorghi]|uniref:Uncharacterized protein n=1 Tax=Puccinia sorghi TaxID=27349 RepID=A0A0L6V0E0_9BASI|nr:hypothetical protein VP01_3193g3 [Puccinia sorghi]
MQVNGILAVPDISIKHLKILEHCHHLVPDLNELDWEENLYAPGLNLSHLNPHTGCPKGLTCTSSDLR